MSKQQIVVVGAGVIGLTVANRLQSSNEFDVAVVAENIPDNVASSSMRSTAWASPWAGAHWRAWSNNQDTQLQSMEFDTYLALLDIAQNDPESGISIAPGIDLYEEFAGEKPWYAAKVRDSVDIPRENLPAGIKYGLQYTTLLINVPRYLVYLKSKFIGAGGRIHRHKLGHIREAIGFASKKPAGTPAIIVNCTGLGSRELGGVNDMDMYPIRGQTVVVYAPEAKRTITRIGSQFSYVIPRGDGTAVIGGTAERGCWDDRPDVQKTQTILRRTLELEPNLLSGGERVWADKSIGEKVNALKKAVVSINVGFRPAREGGVRLQAQTLCAPDSSEALDVVHCYGHAGYGYQSSIAFAESVYRMFKQRAAAA
ncbi:hypothetical protein LPJ56_000722 [Coemansia sp. RSA 2599]|nr:hypothetical protein LPJ75_000303 [Coemansia sp. RSA 2598]KAJ1828993.1 hypothetical protein LPJ56_000722 [Coemansia sp. RSA 2599]